MLMKNDDELANKGLRGQIGAGQDVSRRSFVTTAGLSVLGGSALVQGLASASAAETGANVTQPTEEELAPFKKIARDKGVKLTFLNEKENRVRPLSQMHLDMDMVRASLDNAVERAKKGNRTAILERLERLRANGTAAQKVDFVLGSGNQYMFPEDVEKVAAQAEKDKFHSFGVVCGSFCWLCCVCTANNNQECRERCRDIFCPES
jgi:hypothetical protein